jgi:DUF1365 family protein
MNSCIYEGTVRHRRFAPARHAFRYRIFMTYLDLAELPEALDASPLWSARGPAVAWFRREDHLGDPARPLDDCVRDLVEGETGRRPAGPIRLLTHCRYLGHCMNPVSFFYCHDAADRRVETIVAEVHNTPWNERHSYVLDAAESLRTGRRKRFRFPKRFHVSPFLSMEQEYDWRFLDPGRRLAVHMECVEDGATVLDATLVLARRPLTRATMRDVLVRHPLMTLRVVGAIYAHALRLWRKGVPFHPHPRRRAS